MIIVFGSVGVEVSLGVKNFSEEIINVENSAFEIYAGGRGANQAMAAARSGANVCLIGKIGNSAWSDFVLEKLRHEGIKITGVAQSSEDHTGMWIQLRDSSDNIQKIIAPGASLSAGVSQLPTASLNNRSLVLLQTDLSQEDNLAVLEKAKDKEAITMMNLSPSVDLKKPTLDLLDYLVVNSGESAQLAEKVGVASSESTIKVAQALANIGQLTCIITKGPEGAVAVEKDGKAWSVEALDVGPVIDKTGAEDCYCGTLAACIQAKVEFPQALKRAGIAASITCSQKGGQDSFPYLDDIDTRMHDLGNAERQKIEEL